MLDVQPSPTIAAAVERAVMRSFTERPLPTRRITERECRRRVKICERIWQVLRLECKWSVRRVCDHLFRYLLAELDGIAWEPSPLSLWTPDSPESTH